MTRPSTPAATPARRVFSLLLLCSGLVFLLILWVSGRAFLTEYRSISGGPSSITESEKTGLPPIDDVSWVTGGQTLRGWLAKGQRPEGVVLVHGSGGSRLSMKDELAILSNAGFSVLVYDQPGQGESDGPTSYGPQRREALKDAVHFLKSQPGVERVGALGLSYGGYDLIHVAASTAEIEAVAVGGTPGNLLAHSHYEYQGAFGLRFLGARLAMDLFDVPLTEPSAEQVVAQISPRPILFLHGALDGAVPRRLMEGLHEAAHSPKLWIDLPHSGHCDYGSKDRARYAKVLAEFFERSLSQTQGPLTTP